MNKSETKPKSSLKSKSVEKNVSTPALPKQVKKPSPATKVGKNTPLFTPSKTITRSSTNSLKRRRRYSSSSDDESAPSKTSIKKTLVKKLPPTKTPVKKSPKQKKSKVLFQCSACDKMFPTEALIQSHAEKEHGIDKISVTEEEYADIQTLDLSDEEVTVLGKEEGKKKVFTKDILEETKLDFLDDWDEDENDEITSPSKKLKGETKKKGRGRPRAKSIEIEANEDDKDTSSSPTCLFCHATFSSMESVQDHIKMFHNRSKTSKGGIGSKSVPPDSVASFEIDSTTDFSETKVSANEGGGKYSFPHKSYKCNLCGIKKVSLQFIQKHVKTHKKRISLQCKFCGITCRNNIGLKLHASRCHKVAYIPKKCGLCKFRFLDHKQLRNHIKKVHQRNSRGFKSNDKTKSSLNSSAKVNDSAKKTSNNLESRRGSSSKRTSATDSRKISSSEVSSTSFESDPQNKHKENIKVLSKPNAKKLNCPECSSSFDRPSLLKNHVSRHRASKCMNLGICVYCNKAFLSKDQVVLHTNVVHENLKEIPNCEICEKTYSYAKDLKTHFVKDHWSELTEILVSQVIQQKQMKSRPNQNAGSVSNDVYSKVFKELQDLTGEGNELEDTTKGEHQQQSSLFYSCPLCNFNSPVPDEVNHHLKGHTKNYCNICNSIFNCQELIRHLENHSVLFKSKTCMECKGTFHDDVHLQFHIQHDHPGKKPHKCSMCTNTYITAKSLLNHKQTKHAKKSIKVLSCDWCTKTFLSDKLYQIHVEFAHRSSLNCKYCDKGFDKIKTLVLHEKNHLKQVKSVYKCNVCGKVLKNLASLKSHKINHGSNSSLQCDVCSKSFKSFHTLREHSAKHSDTHQMKYFCDICSKGFYFYDSHYRHRRIHLEPLRLQCKKCKESFPTSETLVDHKKTCTAT